MTTDEELLEINWDSFDVCPNCKSKRVNDLRLNDNIANPASVKSHSTNKNSYCMNCGTEWIQKRGKVYQIIWEQID
jgi:predicted Zn-ribbon and HTH transcriptional regulator